MMNGRLCTLFGILNILMYTMTNAAFVSGFDANGTDIQLTDGPKIYFNNISKSEVILQNGNSYFISCKGKTKVELRQQELAETELGNFSKEAFINTTSDEDYKFEAHLYLNKVNEFAIGYYACFDSMVNASILSYLKEEPKNTEHASFIYVYVNGTDSLLAPMREFIIPRSTQFLIECRPTVPSVQVTLYQSQSNKPVSYTYYSPKIGFILKTDSKSAYTCSGNDGQRNNTKRIRTSKPPSYPLVDGGIKYFLTGESFSINCTVKYTGDGFDLRWTFPKNVTTGDITEATNRYDLDSNTKIVYSNITIHNATKKNEGFYVCTSKNTLATRNNKFKKEHLDAALLTFHNYKTQYHDTRQTYISISVTFDAYPPAEFELLVNNRRVSISGTSKYRLEPRPSFIILNVKPIDVRDTANYTIIAKNNYSTANVSFVVGVAAPPKIFFSQENKTCIKNSKLNLKCEVTGFPIPKVKWLFSPDNTITRNQSQITKSLYEEISYVEIDCFWPGNVTCIATNKYSTKNSPSARILVYEVNDGFGIRNKDKTWFYDTEQLDLECVASKYNYVNVTWVTHPEGPELDKLVQYKNTSLSIVAILSIPHVSLSDSGTYKCLGQKENGSYVSEDIIITVEDMQESIVTELQSNHDGEVQAYQLINLNCTAHGLPPPKIEWLKDDLPVQNLTDGVTITTIVLNRTDVFSSIVFEMSDKLAGTYKCVSDGLRNIDAKQFQLTILNDTALKKYLTAILVVFFLLILLVAYLIWRIKKEKIKRQKAKDLLKAAGLWNFKDGDGKSLNPDLRIEEQAELLPYDDRFEFPADKLTWDVKLGEGAFGEVMKATARGIINAEENTVVAVKKVKNTADSMYIKALASELKIMVHLGKHVNIVNLLGACTNNIGRRELLIIVEYCKFGNIHKYIQRHREVFIDQLTDNKELNLGKVNRGYSNSTGSAGTSEYFGSINTQGTDHTFVNSHTSNSNPSGRKVSEGYVPQPEWRSNYETDYYQHMPHLRPLTSKDLLAWTFQIARGMEYLAKRKILHGDLAARNVLLAEDNVVKICDFGLARSICKNDEYQKTGNSPLPVKWLALECMTSAIFSTQSDVWSFGIVLWEMFSLAKTPYPNIAPTDLVKFLQDGNRLSQPPFADDRLYGVMLRCWEEKPTLRPSFTALQEILGSFLEDNVRNYYVDLNSTYKEEPKLPEQDYLNMVSAPDYNNQVSPSPHLYSNATNFFPPTPKIGEDGYLQMSPSAQQNVFSPRPQGSSKFDFDARKMNQRASDASSCGSELTPMLTLNNIPTRGGSDSDHEGNISPFSKVCGRIEEEADDVFETKKHNELNNHNSAVTNPSYITFGVVDKKPKDISNNYINVPNGLVK